MRQVYWVKMYNAVPVELTPEEYVQLGDMLNGLDNHKALYLLKHETTILEGNIDLGNSLRDPKVIVNLSTTPTFSDEDKNV